MAERNIDTKKAETNKFNETYLSDINGTTFKAVPSEILFKRYFSDLYDNYLRIVVGSDSGLLVDYINNQTIDKNAVHIFIDHPEVVDYINSHYSYDTDKIRLLTFDDDLDSFIKQHFPVFYITAELYLSKSLCVIDSHADYAERFKEVLEWFNSFLAKRNFEISDNLFIDTNINDQAFLDNSLAALEKKIENIPALILGGGPTLDEHVEWIKKHQSKFIVIAVGRIAHRLAEEEIKPDAIVTIDPSELSFSNSKETLSFSDESLLVSSNHPNFKLTGQWRGKSVYMGRRLSIPSVENPPSILPRGNTVSNFAAQFAMVIGCRDIYLSGVDFCYLASGQSHEGKSLESTTGISSDIASQILNYAGQTVGTRPNFKLAKTSFDLMIRDFKQAFEDLNVYALSDKSAYMEHVECIPFSTVELSAYSDENKSAFQKLLDTHLVTENAALVADLEERRGEVQKLIKKLNKAQAYIRKKTAQLDPEWTDLDFINDQLQKFVVKVEDILGKSLIEMIKAYGYQKLINSIKKDAKSVKESNNLLELDRISYLNLLNETMDTLLEELKKSEKHINIRRAETKRSLEPSVLMEYWIKQELPGRIFIWEQHFPTLYNELKSKHPEMFEHALLAYKNQFESSQSIKQTLEKKAKSIQYFLKNISQYKNEGNTELLKGLKKQINQINNKAYNDLNTYIDAVIADLKGNKTKAVQCIDEIEKKGIIQFNALQLKLSISMDLATHQTTLETFLTLCEYSPSYMPQYAEFLKLIGNGKAAIEIYKMYLSIVPNDTENIIKLYHLLAEYYTQEDANAFLAQKHQELPNDPLLNKVMN